MPQKVTHPALCANSTSQSISPSAQDPKHHPPAGGSRGTSREGHLPAVTSLIKAKRNPPPVGRTSSPSQTAPLDDNDSGTCITATTGHPTTTTKPYRMHSSPEGATGIRHATRRTDFQSVTNRSPAHNGSGTYITATTGHPTTTTKRYRTHPSPEGTTGVSHGREPVVRLRSNAYGRCPYQSESDSPVQ